MPWTPSEASRFTHKAKSSKAKRQWSKVADSMLARTGDDGAAIRAANSVAKKSSAKRTRRRKATRS